MRAHGVVTVLAVGAFMASCSEPPPPQPRITLDPAFDALETTSLTMELIPGWSVTAGVKSFAFKPQARVVLNKRVIPADGKLPLLFKSATGKQQFSTTYDFGAVTIAANQSAIYSPNRRLLITRDVHAVSVKAMFDTFVAVDGRAVALDQAGDGDVPLSLDAPLPLWSAALFAHWCVTTTEVAVVLPGHAPFVATLSVDERERARWLAAQLAARLARALLVSPLANTVWPL